MIEKYWHRKPQPVTVERHYERVTVQGRYGQPEQKIRYVPAYIPVRSHLSPENVAHRERQQAPGRTPVLVHTSRFGDEGYEIPGGRRDPVTGKRRVLTARRVARELRRVREAS